MQSARTGSSTSGSSVVQVTVRSSSAWMQALSAVTSALCDLAGRQLDLPVQKMTGGARRDHLACYCTIHTGLPGPGRDILWSLVETARQFDAVPTPGFRAVKMAVAHDAVTDAELVGLNRQRRCWAPPSA